MAEWERTLDLIARERGPALVRYAYLLCGDWARAEDLVQDALVKTFTRGRAGAKIENAEGYIRRSIATTSIDGFRVQRRWAAVRHLFARPEVHGGPENAVGDRMDIAEALAALSPRQRTCIVLRYYEDLSIAQVADQLGLAVGTTKRYLSDGIAALEAQLGALETDDARSPDYVQVIERRSS